MTNALPSSMLSRASLCIGTRHGKVTLRYDSRLHHIGLGMRHRGKSIVLFVADRQVRIVDADGELLRS